MRPVTPPPAWKAVFLPGLLLGVLLALLQVALFSWGPILGIPSFVDSFAPVWYLWLFYLVLPALFGFLITVRTGKPATGYRVGRLAGIACAVLLLGVTVGAILYTVANPPTLRGLGSGAFLLADLVEHSPFLCSSMHWEPSWPPSGPSWGAGRGAEGVRPEQI